MPNQRLWRHLTRIHRVIPDDDRKRYADQARREAELPAAVNPLGARDHARSMGILADAVEVRVIAEIAATGPYRLRWDPDPRPAN